MSATLKAHTPTGGNWAWELKWDGIRALGYVTGGALRLYTRNGNEVTHRYPELQPLASAFGERDAVVDGEIVTFDDSGRPSFERLQQRMHVEDRAAIARLRQSVPVVYVLFDLLWLDGRSLLAETYERRRAELAALGLQGDAWQTPPNEVGDGRATFDVSMRFGIEGVVAKRLDSRYEPGRRSPAWVKVKHSLRQEFVVGGWMPGEGGRTGTIGSLLVGYYEGEGEQRVLHYAGRVGSGLRQRDLAFLGQLFATCARDTSPFGAGAPPKRAHFVEPIVVAEVRFSEWTAGGVIRQPSLLGYRTDKAASDVVRERPT